MQSSLTISFSIRQEINARLDELIDSIPEGRPQITVDQYAEQNRILPENTPYPGRWQNERVPFFVDIMRDLSANSPIRELALVKPIQIGATSIVENLIAYVIACNPAPTLYVTANDLLARQWSNIRLIPLLKSTGLEDKLQATAVLKKNNRSGVTTQLKEFAGGVLGLGSGQSESSLRTFSYCNVILDEVSAYPISVNGRGDPIGLARARATNYPLRKKIFYLSSPGDLGNCKITELFEQGDQRYWFVCCPICNEEIVLEFSNEYAPYHEKMEMLDRDFGLVWELDGKQIREESIGYKCPHCTKVFKETHKWDIVQKGRWKPTDTSVSKYFRSYCLSSLPSLLFPWRDIVQDWISCGDNEEKKKVFVNARCGMAYRVTSAKPKFASLMSLRGNYEQRQVPVGVLFLTVAVDVQQGSRTNPDNPARLEMEVCGHGLLERTWSIEYKKFIGSIDDPSSGAWEQLYNYVRDQFVYKRFDGMTFSPVVGFVDARSGVVTQIVCDFCNTLDFWFPSMSNNKDMKVSDDAEVVEKLRLRDNILPYKESKSGDNSIILLSPNLYKRKVYSHLSVERRSGKQKYGFCEFPKSYTEVYFKGLVSEEMTVDGSFIKRRAIRNEPLDLRVYNLCAARFYIDLLIAKQRRFLETTKKWPKEMAREVVNAKFVLQQIEKETKVKEVA